MSPKRPLRFITASEMEVEESAWVRVAVPARPDRREGAAPRPSPHGAGAGPRLSSTSGDGGDHLPLISGHAEQWVDRTSRPLGPGESAHIPRDVVHGTYNAGDETLVFLAILSPAIVEGPAVVDASREEPWASLRPTSAPARQHCKGMPTVLLIGTLDTKAEEYKHVRDRILAAGHQTLVMDLVLSDPPFLPEIPSADVALAAARKSVCCALAAIAAAL